MSDNEEQEEKGLSSSDKSKLKQIQMIFKSMDANVQSAALELLRMTQDGLDADL